MSFLEYIIEVVMDIYWFFTATTVEPEPPPGIDKVTHACRKWQETEYYSYSTINNKGRI